MGELIAAREYLMQKTVDDLFSYIIMQDRPWDVCQSMMVLTDKLRDWFETDILDSEKEGDLRIQRLLLVTIVNLDLLRSAFLEFYGKRSEIDIKIN